MSRMESVTIVAWPTKSALSVELASLLTMVVMSTGPAWARIFAPKRPS